MSKTIAVGDDVASFKQQLQGLDETELQAVREAVLIELARGDDVDALTAYCEYVHGWTLAPHHKEWAEYLMGDEPVCICAPPESGKSRLVRAWKEWDIGKRPNDAGFIIQRTDDQSADQVRSIGDVLKSERYRKVFPHIKPTENWGGSSITVQRDTFRPDATLKGYGIHGSYQGKHVETIVLDDPTNQKDVLSPTVMLGQQEQIKGVLIDRLKKKGKLVVILTRWSPNDIVPTLEQLGVRVVVYPAWKPASQPYPWDQPQGECEQNDTPECATGQCEEQVWRDKHGAPHVAHIKHQHSLLYADQYNETELTLKREQKGHDFFRLTFLCQPEAALRGDLVLPQLLMRKHYQPISIKTQFVRTVIGVDWGTSVTHQSALVVLSKTDSGLIVARAAWQSPKGSSHEMAELLSEWKPRFNIQQGYIDPSQGSLIDSFTFNMRIQSFKGNRWVFQRIGAMTSLLDADQFIIDPLGPGTEYLYQSLAGWRYDENGRVVEIGDDLADACGYAAAALVDPAKIGIGPMVQVSEKRVQGQTASVDHDNWDPAKDTSWMRQSGSGGWGSIKSI